MSENGGTSFVIRVFTRDVRMAPNAATLVNVTKRTNSGVVLDMDVASELCSVY